MKEQEIRTITIEGITVESRAADSGQMEDTISGYGIVFNSESRILGGSWYSFTEVIDARALDGVDMSEVVATFNHNFDNILARADAKTLKLTIDAKGLKYEFKAPNTTAGRDLVENIKNGNVKGSSFIFTTEEDRWTYTKDETEPDKREVLKVERLIELGPVVMPAYADTTAAKRSFELSLEKREKPEPTTDFERLEKLYKAHKIKQK